MITLYKTESDKKGEEVEEKLNDLVLSFKVEKLTDSEKKCYIFDGNNIISGDGEIDLWLRKLEDEIFFQRTLSGDGCYIDPDSGGVC